MKKKYFVFLIVLSSILFPNNIFAQNIIPVPNQAKFFRADGTYSTITTFKEKIINQRYFNTFDGTHTTAVNDINWYYNTTFGLDTSSTYDVNFSVLVPNIGVANNQGFQSGKPLVTFNASVCDVYSLSSTYSSSITYSDVFNVVCRNVDILEHSEVSVFTPNTSQESSSLYLGGPATFGISKTFNFVVHNSSSDITGAIKENTEELKKQTEEQKKQTEEIKKNTEATKEQTDTIKDSDTTEASDSANSFFGDFESDDYGLSDIITMPLSFINGLSSSTCNSLEFPVPFVNQNVELPCMSSIYKKHFSSFLSLYQIITTGIIAYWCCVNMFRLVQGFKDPEKDEIEVLDL